MGVVTRCVNGVCVCVLPMPANNDRPLLLNKGPLALLSALLVVAKLSAFTVLALTPVQAELSTITTERIIQLTNAERTKRNLNALKINTKLTQAAQEKGEDMLKNDYFAHISPSGVTPWFWMNKEGYSYQVAGENLAIDFLEAEDVVAAWIASPSHKENMLLPDYTETGVAAVTGEFQGGTSTIVVHFFGLPAGQAGRSTGTLAGELTTRKPAPKPTLEPTASPTATPTPTTVPSTARVPAVTPVPTPPPRVPRIADLTFVLSPATDQSQVAMRFTAAEVTEAVADDGTATKPIRPDAWALLAARAAPFTLSADDSAGNKTTVATTTLIPQFTDRMSTATLAAPSAYWQLARRLAALIFAIIAVLLVLAIFIRIHIQHVGLITHATAVLALAAGLFLW